MKQKDFDAILITVFFTVLVVWVIFLCWLVYAGLHPFMHQFVKALI